MNRRLLVEGRSQTYLSYVFTEKSEHITLVPPKTRM